ncbi:ABC transporter ATP-binding protein/permease [Peptacetobacter hiranonis]|uniref:ABC transporter ATP-binding protein/permease n=1 Tax=Peptacetobacter hiranonis TaxID=89152 RepID=UPI002E7636AF|nr:ABC transporter ATP-binding protein/permease [Peptacetobacter hiranonis]MEE0247983.1 ABC transporter ATP-binding protein/permease [Peptacetobacter hiranonis]
MMINKRLINEMGDTNKYIKLQVFLQWIALLCNIVMVFTLTSLLQKAINGGVQTGEVIKTALVFIVVMAIRHIVMYKESVCSGESSKVVKSKLRHMIYEKLLKIGDKYQDKFSTSEILQVSAEGVEQLEIYFSKYLPQLFYSLLAPMTLFVLVSFMSLKTAFVLFICVPLIPISIIRIQKFAKKLLAKYWGSYVQLGDHFLDNMQGLTTLKVYQSDEFKNEEMNVDAENFRRITMKVLTMQLNSVTLMDLIAYGGSALGVVFASLEFAQGNIEFSQALAIILLSAEFFIPLRLLGSFFHIAMNGMAASEKMFRLIDMEEDSSIEKEYFNNGKEVSVDKNTEDKAYISGENIVFGYEEGKNVIKGISFEIPKNSFVSIVGESGCGKSTLASILMGYNKINSGKLSIKNRNAEEISTDEKMKLMTMVSFQNYLFKGTVRENLLMGRDDIKDDKLLDALKSVNLYEFFSTLEGLDTKIAEQASNLSAGQRQRLCIARALLHNSEIYIFDEATSNIDVESEEIIVDLIKKLKREKTVIQITHRLANVVESDEIYMMDSGNIIEKGTHSELMERKGRYEKMYTAQKELELYAREEAM